MRRHKRKENGDRLLNSSFPKRKKNIESKDEVNNQPTSTNSPWFDLFPDPNIHFQKDRAVRLMLAIRAFFKELSAIYILNTHVLTIIYSYALDLISLNSLLKIVTNSFESVFYPPSLIEKASNTTKQPDMMGLINEVLNAMQFLQVKSVIEEMCDPWCLLIKIDPRFSQHQGIDALGKKFLQHIFRVADAKPFKKLLTEFIQKVKKIIYTINVDSDLLQLNLVTAMHRNLKNLVYELHILSNLLSKDILSSNEDISTKLIPESPTQWSELVESTKHAQLKEFYQHLKDKNIPAKKALEFARTDLSQLILIQCFKNPNIAYPLYDKLIHDIFLNGLIFGTGLVKPFPRLKPVRPWDSKDIHDTDNLQLPEQIDFIILKLKIQKPAYESHYFIFLLYYLNTHLSDLSNILYGRRRKPYNHESSKQYNPRKFREIIQFYLNTPGLVNNILFLLEAEKELEFFGLKRKNHLFRVDSRLSSDYFFSEILERWQNYPLQLEYRLIKHLGKLILANHIKNLTKETSNVDVLLNQLSRKIEYFWFYFDDLHKQYFLESLETIQFCYYYKFNENQSELLKNIIQKITCNKKISANPDEKKLSLRSDLSNLEQILNNAELPALMKILPRLYNTPGLQNIWLDLIVPSNCLLKPFDHPLLFLLRRASKKELQQITAFCPHIWINLFCPTEKEFLIIMCSQLPSEYGEKAFIFRNYLNPDRDTLHSYAARNGNFEAVQFFNELYGNVSHQLNDYGPSRREVGSTTVVPSRQESRKPSSLHAHSSFFVARNPQSGKLMLLRRQGQVLNSTQLNKK